MSKIKIFISLFSIGFLFNTVFAQKNFTKYVDPRIGNVSTFLVPTYPTFQLPNQQLRMFPIKTDYIDDQVTAWPLQVMWHRNTGIMRMKVSLGEITNKSWTERMTIDHDREIVHPWHYSTYLIDDNITVSFTPTNKCAAYKVDFPASEAQNVLIAGTNDMKAEFFDDNKFILEEKHNYLVKGTSPQTRTMAVFCYAEIVDKDGKPVKGAKFNHSKGKISITFADQSAKTVIVKYAISYISAEQAKINFSKEIANLSFEKTIANAKNAWAEVINQIQVKGGTTAQRRSFYTALYRTYERMIDIKEYGQYYSGFDGKIHKSDRPFMVDDWIWDTFLATHPLRTILNPDFQSDVLNSYTNMYEQSGWMPTFPQVFGNHLCMNGYRTASIFTDAHRKGIKGFDIEKAYEGIRKNLTEGTLIPWRQGYQRTPLDDFYHEHGFFPALRPGEKETEPLVDGFEKRQPVAVSLGMSYDAWCLAELAKELGKKDDYQKFSDMAQNYRKLWHPDMRLFMPKDSNGEWIMINPKLDGGRGYREYYDENNGWTYAWQVQHDIEGLTGLFGGKKATENRLDQLFREPLDIRRNEFYVDGSNATGLVGQFSMGNEPSFHIPYLYNYVGAPWKTQKRIRFLLDVWFKDNIFGIPGDEDGGGMSAFVVLSSLGFYPVTPGLPIYSIGSPIFEKSSIKLPNKKTFTVIAKGASAENKYIQKAYFNGKEIFTPFFTHDELMAGGKLELVLGIVPNKEWGVK